MESLDDGGRFAGGAAVESSVKAVAQEHGADAGGGADGFPLHASVFRGEGDGLDVFAVVCAAVRDAQSSKSSSWQGVTFPS